MEQKSIIKETKTQISLAVSRDNLIIQTSHTINEVVKSINRIYTVLRERYGLYAPYSARLEIKELLNAIKSPKREDMGIELKKKDIESIKKLAKNLEQLLELQQEQEEYLEILMKELCPKFQKVATTLIGAKLIDAAGSIKQLAEMPSSKIQVLGAEKALFRHLKTNARPPKFGIIFSHSEITKAKEKGKASRKLAAQLSIAIKQDYFSK